MERCYKKIDPKFFLVYNNLGNAYSKIREFDKSN